MVLLQGLGIYKKGREIYKRLIKTTAKKKKELKQSIKEHQETIYCNTILAKLILKRYIKVKGIKANLGKCYRLGGTTVTNTREYKII